MFPFVIFAVIIFYYSPKFRKTRRRVKGWFSFLNATPVWRNWYGCGFCAYMFWLVFRLVRALVIVRLLYMLYDTFSDQAMTRNNTLCAIGALVLVGYYTRETAVDNVRAYYNDVSVVDYSLRASACMCCKVICCVHIVFIGAAVVALGYLKYVQTLQNAPRTCIDTESVMYAFSIAK